MKNFYILVNYEENGKYYPYIIKTNDSNNLLSELARHKNLISANIMPTLKKARTTCEAWRKAYKENGTYLF